MRVLIGVISAMALVWPISASANWQYTTWGMTIEQVETASKNAASPTTPTVAQQQSPTDHSLTASLSAPYKSGAFSFTAYFMFDNAGKLAGLHLVLESGNPDALIGAVRIKYGKPVSEDNDNNVLDSIDWYAAGDMIYIDKIGDGMNGQTSLDYKPRLNDDNKGL